MTIIIIVVRKFSVLANLDVDTIQAEREIKVKEKIISNRLKRNYFRYYFKLVNSLKPLGLKIGELSKEVYQKLIDFKDNYNKEEDKKEVLKPGQVDEKSMLEAEELKKQEDWGKAEKKYIDLIGEDSTNIKAFRGLGEVYFERKDFTEAKETLEHVLKLLEKKLDDFSVFGGKGEISDEQKSEKDQATREFGDIYFDLSLVEKAAENYKGAQIAITKALKVQPNNPRYLDTKFEISIINKDKDEALFALDRLRDVNPENQKLDEMKAELDKL